MSFVRGILTTLVAILSSLLLSLCLILALLIWPFSRKVHYRTNCFLANAWGEFCVWWARVVCGVKLKIDGELWAQHENAIVIANHQSMVDMVVYFMFASRFDRIGDSKSFSKQSLKYWPGLGWALMMLNVIFVKRSWPSDERPIKKQFEKIKNRGEPFWVVIFPEGTRITPEKLAASQEIARQKNLPILSQVLLPRSKGFVTAVTMLREEIAVVYDLTINYGEKIPSLVDLACGRLKKVSLYERRFAVDVLPQTEEELARWLVERFAEKNDQLRRSGTSCCGG